MINCEIDKNANLVFTTIKGEVTANEVLAALTGLLDSPEYRPGLNGLVDLRESDMDPDAKEIRKIAALLINNKERIGESRSAIVVSEDLAYGLARMFEAYADESSIETRIFRDMEAARSWLDRPQA